MKVLNWIIRTQQEENTHDNIIRKNHSMNLNALIMNEITKQTENFTKEKNDNKREQLIYYIEGLLETSNIIINNAPNIMKEKK